MLITLNNGRTVDISAEQFLDMSDAEFLVFMDRENGEDINDPFYRSQLHRKSTSRLFDENDFEGELSEEAQ